MNVPRHVRERVGRQNVYDVARFEVSKREVANVLYFLRGGKAQPQIGKRRQGGPMANSPSHVSLAGPNSLFYSSTYSM